MHRPAYAFCVVDVPQKILPRQLKAFKPTSKLLLLQRSTPDMWLVSSYGCEAAALSAWTRSLSICLLAGESGYGEVTDKTWAHHSVTCKLLSSKSETCKVGKRLSLSRSVAVPAWRFCSQKAKASLPCACLDRDGILG